MSIKSDIDPCEPCLCPRTLCKQCIFMYKGFEERHKLLNEVVENNKYSDIVERYKLYHKY